uniref:C-type lectin domain family 4 member M-like isoform X2 n=1 Tax=Doryrhamphus excisus TaxID=161450 RepID=UPI0025AEA951|nr:C-type lectin domain family 4 member M-like isoform X2 [Doryrhamphus excisus]
MDDVAVKDSGERSDVKNEEEQPRTADSTEMSSVGDNAAVKEKHAGSRPKMMSWTCELACCLMGFFIFLLGFLAAIFIINSKLDELMNELINTQTNLKQQIDLMLMKRDELQEASRELKERLAASEKREDNVERVWLEHEHLNATLNTMLTDLNNLELSADEFDAQRLVVSQRYDGIKASLKKMTASINSCGKKTEAEISCDSMSQTVSTLQQETDQLTKGLSTLADKETKQYNLLCYRLDKNHLTEKEIECCPSGWEPHASHCYYMSNERVEQEEAVEKCIKKGGQLADIDDMPEQKFITRLIYKAFQERLKKGGKKNPKGHAAWIGLNDRVTEGEYFWLDGRPLTEPIYWQIDEPNNYVSAGGDQDCVVIVPPQTMVQDEFDDWDDRHFKTWDDLLCTNNRYYVCAKKSAMG